MNKIVSLENKTLTCIGRSVQLHRRAPDFTAVSEELKDLTLSSFGKRIKVINFFLSLDTPVCDIQVREFNKFASALEADTVVIGISRDLPFAQKRFKETFHIRNMQLISDYKYGSFGINYGVLIKELNLLARGVVILDCVNTVRYLQLNSELSNQPDYEETHRQLEEVRKNPAEQLEEQQAVQSNEAFKNQSVKGDKNTSLLPSEAIEKLLLNNSEWKLFNGKILVRQLRFKSFTEAKYSLDLLVWIAEEQKHHPSFLLDHNRLKVTLTTHDAGGLTEKDFIMAGIIDDVTGD
jgi:thiol peroxidase